jgi:hypothetical protein
MYTTGAGAQIATVFFFMLIMIGGFCSSIIQFIAAIIFPGTGYTGQKKQINTEYEHECFHKAKIKTISPQLKVLSQQSCNDHNC